MTACTHTAINGRRFGIDPCPACKKSVCAQGGHRPVGTVQMNGTWHETCYCGRAPVVGGEPSR